MASVFLGHPLLSEYRYWVAFCGTGYDCRRQDLCWHKDRDSRRNQKLAA